MNIEQRELNKTTHTCDGHNCWDHADPLPALAESALSKLSSLRTDASGRTDAATFRPSAGASVLLSIDELVDAARSRLGEGRALREYVQGLVDMREFVSQRL